MEYKRFIIIKEVYLDFTKNIDYMYGGNKDSPKC